MRSTLDAGVSRVNEADVAAANGASIGGTVDALSSRAWLRASALAMFGVGSDPQQSVQGLLAASGDLRGSGLVRPFVSAALSVFTQTNVNAASSGEVSFGVRASGAGRGGSLAAGAGTTTGSGVARPVFRALSDGWLVSGPDQFSAELAVTSSNVRFLAGTLTAEPATTHAYVGLTGAWRHDGAGLTVNASLGAQNSSSVVTGGVWGAGDVALWVAPRAALVVGGGNLLEDVVRGTPRTRYVTAGVRLSGEVHRPILRRGAPSGARMIALAVGERRRIEIAGVSAARVELIADFTQWQPVALERVGDAWRLEQSIAPGPHRVAVRIDGGEWIVPVNLPRVEDDLGGAVGLITVP